MCYKVKIRNKKKLTILSHVRGLKYWILNAFYNL